jgi:hypothetical protein
MTIETDILDALQQAEELGGPELPEYIALMDRIASEAKRRANVARERDERTTITDTEAVECIHQVLDGTEWGSDSLEVIAQAVRETGRVIRDINEFDDDAADLT